MIYYPRCDKRITPDHRCLSRRHFFGILAGAAALLVAPKVVPANCLTAGDFRKARNILRAGDSLSVTFTGHTAVARPGFHVSIVPCANPTTMKRIESGRTGAFFIADQDYLIERITYSTAYGRANVPIEIKRSAE